MSARLERAQLLLEQSRYDLAERELRGALAATPASPLGHALLALCLSQGERHAEATEEAAEAVRLAPDWGFTHYVMADVLERRERIAEAREAIMEALRLDPSQPHFYAKLAQIQAASRAWGEVLAAAERGLAIDPQHVDCANLRSLALVQLGRGEEAGQALAATLARDPDNAMTHANQGWARLHAADHRAALDHFGEALRRDPELEWARLGLLEALKARNPVYGLLLRYFLWMSRLSGGVQLAVLLGGYLGFRTLREVAETVPGLRGLVLPLVVVYGLFAFLTWTADPLFTLTLRLNRFGRLVLNREEVLASNLVGLCLALALAALAGALVTGREAALLAALAVALVAIPVAAVFQCRPGWPRVAMTVWTAAVALLAVAGLGAALAGDDGSDNPGLALSALALVGVLVSSWVGLALTTRQPRR